MRNLYSLMVLVMTAESYKATPASFFPGYFLNKLIILIIGRVDKIRNLLWMLKIPFCIFSLSSSSSSGPLSCLFWHTMVTSGPILSNVIQVWREKMGLQKRSDGTDQLQRLPDHRGKWSRALPCRFPFVSNRTSTIIHSLVWYYHIKIQKVFRLIFGFHVCSDAVRHL